MDPVDITGGLVLMAVTGATVAFLWKVRRHHAPIALTASSAVGFFSGLLTAGLAVGHLGGVAVVELTRSPVRYTFRVYALLLLGVTLVVLGASLAAASARVVRGERPAWRRAVRAALVLLAVNVPLAPIQGFAVFLGVFVTISLVALLAAKARIVNAG
jgi:hypothetical protein